MVYVLLIVLSLFARQLAADATTFFNFLDTVKTLKAEFIQHTYRDGILVEELKGTFELKRPDRFRWAYTEPYLQEIIADGKKIWIYDPDLFQVTIKPQTETLGNSPALILSRGSLELKKRFLVQKKGGWLHFQPRQQGEVAFERIEILFDGKLRQMRLEDNFGQRIEITFLNLKINLPLPDERFRFSPPPGIDVIEE